jgi:hypothetical protein
MQRRKGKYRFIVAVGQIVAVQIVAIQIIAVQIVTVQMVNIQIFATNRECAMSVR